MKSKPILVSIIPLLAISPVSGQQMTAVLDGTWGQYDKNEIVNGPPGILALTGESPTGFTAAVGANTLLVPSTSNVDASGRPRIFETFQPIAFSTVGKRATFKFKIKLINTFPSALDAAFRFGIVDTANNQGMFAAVDAGNPSGTTVRIRQDMSITASTGIGTGGVILPYVPGDWSNFGDNFSAKYIYNPQTMMNDDLVDPATGLLFATPKLQAGDTVGSVSGSPNSNGLSNTTTTHSLQLVLERIATGIKASVRWGNDAGPAVIECFTSTVTDDSYLPMNTIDGIGWVLFNNTPYGAATTGSFIISDVSVVVDDIIPRITAINREVSGDVVIDFTGGPGTAYSVTKSPDLVTPFGPLTVPLSVTPDSLGLGQALVPAMEASEDKEFYRIELP